MGMHLVLNTIQLLVTVALVTSECTAEFLLHVRTLFECTMQHSSSITLSESPFFELKLILKSCVTSSIDELLDCECEAANHHDPYAVTTNFT